MPADVPPPDDDRPEAPSVVRRLLGRLYQPGGFRHGVLTLLSGTTVAVAVGYLVQPLLTRLYTPEAFGILDAFVSLLSIVLPFASLRYEDALMLPEDDDEAAPIWGLSVVLMVTFTILTGLLMVWRVPLARWLGAPDLAGWLFLLPPTLLAMRSAKLAELWLVRHKRFRPVSAGQVVRSLSRNAFQVVGGLRPFAASPAALIGGFLVGHAASALVFLRGALRIGGLARRRTFRPSAIRQAAYRYRRFALFSTPSTLLNALLVHLPFLLLLKFFGEATVGYFGRTLLGLATPMGLIGLAVGHVFFVHGAEARRAGTLTALSTNVHNRLVMVGLFPTLALLLAGPDVFAFFFGAAWRTSGLYVQYLGLWLLLAGIASPLTRLFDILERQRMDLAMSLLLFSIQTAAVVMGGLSGDLLLTLLLLGAAGTVARVFHIAALLHIGGVSVRAGLRPYARYALFSLPGLLLIAAVLPLGRPWLTTLAVAGGGLLYAGIVLWRDRMLLD